MEYLVIFIVEAAIILVLPTVIAFIFVIHYDYLFQKANSGLLVIYGIALILLSVGAVLYLLTDILTTRNFLV